MVRLPLLYGRGHDVRVSRSRLDRWCCGDRQAEQGVRSVMGLEVHGYLKRQNVPNLSEVWFDSVPRPAVVPAKRSVSVEVVP